MSWHLQQTESSFVTDTGKNGEYSYNNYHYQLCIITGCDVDVLNEKNENPCNSPLNSGDEEGKVHKSAQMLYFSYSVIINVDYNEIVIITPNYQDDKMNSKDKDVDDINCINERKSFVEAAVQFFRDFHPPIR